MIRAAFVFAFLAATALAAPVEQQPFLSATARLVEAMDFTGTPLSAEEKAALTAGIAAQGAAAVEKAQAVLDAHALFVVSISPEQRVKVAQGAAKPVLDEGGWRQFLVKVVNEAGTTAKLAGRSAEAKTVYGPGPPRDVASPADHASRWLDMQMFEAPPLRPALSGLGIEYRIVQLYARDAGKREATFSFDTGQGTQDLGFRNEVSVLFDCQPARAIKLTVLDENGAPCVGEFLIKDRVGRVYPSQAKRVAPDFFFHPQVYRGDGETLKLPEGDYDITFARGPESVPERRTVKFDAKTTALRFQVKRWVDPSKLGWWSGDHHIHAAGCAHYVQPTEGVHAPDMARHCQGEDLKIGANLTWGPCFDYQKQFFTGAEDKVSSYPFLLRYDVEVSGFGSHRSGHLCLLKLREQMYPGGDSSKHWPTLCLNTLKWAKAQGALVGPAHSGWGLQPIAEDDPNYRKPYGGAGQYRSATFELPNYIVPPFTSIGAQEYIADVTHEVPGPDGKLVPAVDFLSMCDTPPTWELNIWYHTLNAGFRTRVSGETDFPCIYGERVGLGRSYVKLDGKLTYDAWCEGIRAGRNYVSDGRSHLINFKANDVAVGENGSELRLAAPATIKLTVQVAARLDEQPRPEFQGQNSETKPFWHVERARIGATREVPVELLVNGEWVEKQNIVADGALRELTFHVPVKKSCWVALRILPTSHTNPIFVIVGHQPIREKRSLEWCLKCVDQCWKQKEALIDPREHADAVACYEHAREVYRARLAGAR
jgi:hypothetical protein